MVRKRRVKLSRIKKPRTMIKYDEVEKLGFKRTEEHDPVFFKQYGYEYFFMEKKLLKCKKGVHICSIWNPETQDIDLMKCNREGTILQKINFTNINEYLIFHKFISR